MKSIFQFKTTTNFLSILLGNGLSLVLNFVSITLTARFLQVEDFGEFNFLLATTFIFSKLIDLGLAQISFRELSVNKENSKILNDSFFIKIIAFFIVIVFYNLSTNLLGFNKIEIVLSNILFLNVIFSSKFQNFRELFDVPFKVNLDMHFSSIFSNLDNVIFLILVLLFPLVDGNLTYIVISYVISNIFGFTFTLILLKKKYNYTISLTYNFKVIGGLLKLALPIGGFIILNTLYQQIDIFYLRYFDSSYSAGIYSASLRLIIPIAIIPTALAATFFPQIVRNVLQNEHNKELINLIYKILFLLSFSLAVMITFKSKTIIILIFGDSYAESAYPMVILFWSYVFLFFNFFSLDLIVAYNKQIYNLNYSIITLILNVILLYYLVPYYSYNGAAFAKIGAAVIGTVYTIFILKRNLIVDKIFLNLNILFICVLITLSAFLFSSFPILLYLFLTPLTMLILTKVLKYFNNSEIIRIFKAINKEHWGVKLTQ